MCRLQAYAYCGCYYALPADLYDCANVQLKVRPNTPASTLINSGAPQNSNPPTTGQSLISFLSYGPSSSSDTPGSSDISTLVSSSPPPPLGSYPTVSSSSSISSPTSEPSKLTLTGPPQPSRTQVTSTVRSVVTTTGITAVTSPYSTVSSYTTSQPPRSIAVMAAALLRLYLLLPPERNRMYRSFLESPRRVSRQ